eukprot:m.303991 g.303991  ORF g.303991 m.303991 type:complete len:109 (+) comp23010_c0_seq2:95-421(+)
MDPYLLVAVLGSAAVISFLLWNIWKQCKAVNSNTMLLGAASYMGMNALQNSGVEGFGGASQFLTPEVKQFLLANPTITSFASYYGQGVSGVLQEQLASQQKTTKQNYL